MQYRILIAAISLCLLGWGGINLGGGTPDPVGGGAVFVENFDQTSGADCATGELHIDSVSNGESGQCDIAVSDPLCSGGKMTTECAILDGTDDDQNEHLLITDSYSGTDDPSWLCATISIEDDGNGVIKVLSLRTGDGGGPLCELRVNNASANLLRIFCGGLATGSGNMDFVYAQGVPFNIKIKSDGLGDDCTVWVNGTLDTKSCTGGNTFSTVGDVKMETDTDANIAFDNIQFWTTDPGTACD